MTRTARFFLFATGASMAWAAPHSARAADDQISRGQYIAVLGDCDACHTAPGGQKLAGGVALKTPFGTMYTPNITPDKATGIGGWSDDDFYRLFHNGIGKGHAYIYPGFPYPWFTKASRDDVLALKAYLFTLSPVSAPKKANQLMFPLQFRPLMIGWNMLFFKPGTFKADPSKSAEVNRGAYLVEGFAHCSDCHTPKNVAQAPIDNRAYAGGKFDNWYAPNISSDKAEGIGAWSEDTLVNYLRTGTSPTKGVALGPMAQGVHDSYSHMTNADLHAIAAYMATVKPQKSYEQRQSVLVSDARPGAPIYLTYCSSCHQENGQGETGKIPALADNGAVTSKGPQNVIRVVVGGVRAQGSYGPMPGFGAVMSDQQIADVTNYVRGAWSNRAPEAAGPGDVSAVASETRSLLAGTQPCPPAGTSPLDSAIADPTSGIQDSLKSVSEENLVQSINKLVTLVKSKAPEAKQDELVNQLTDAYCPVVTADVSLNAMQRWTNLTQFSEQLYVQLTTHGRD